jgi:hypothetical protein
LFAALSALAFPPQSSASALADSNIGFSNLQITPASGTLQLLGNWAVDAFAQAQNSLGEQLPDYQASGTGGPVSADAAVTWAADHGDATAPVTPDLPVTGHASSLANVPGCPPNWASSQGSSSFANTLQVTGGSGSVSVDMSADISGLLHVFTDACGVRAETQLIFSLEIFGLPDVGGGPQNPLVLFSSQYLRVGPNSQISLPFGETLAGSATLEFDKAYGFLIQLDSESYAIVPEPATAALLLPGLAWLARRRLRSCCA